ncbi:MAG: type II secretion system protein GspM [Haliea sp.]|jgi:general secretion pathway protein M
MQAWFARLDRREQLSLLVLAAVIVLYLLWILLWSPVAAMRDRMLAQNTAAAAALVRVDTLVAELQQARASAGPGGQRSNLTAVVNQSTARFGLPVNRLQPGSRGDLQVRLENARFADLIAWLHHLELAEGLMLDEVAITQAGSAGFVNATVRIGQGS